MRDQNNEPSKKIDLFILAEAALIRAQQRAHEKAWQHGGTVAIWEDGKVVHLAPQPMQHPERHR